MIISLQKTIDKVKTSGMIAFITSKGTLDKANPSVRKYIAERADLIGAIRLPNAAFKNANTDVTSDIIFLQKRKRMQVVNTSWIYTGVTKDNIPVNYASNHHETLMNYMLDGRCEISNNAAERRAITYVMSKKNFLFHDTTDGAKASAIVLSIIETVKANQLNIFQYLYTLLLYTPNYKDEFAGIKQLMPWSEFIKERCSGVMDTETEIPENRGSIPILSENASLLEYLSINGRLFITYNIYK